MAKPRRNNEVKLLGVVRRKRPALMMSTALQATVMLVLSLPAHAQPAPNARPTGGSVVGGSAAISNTANNTRIDQSTQRAAIDWKTFNVGSQQSVTFHQPTTSSVTLNRVTGPDPSQIAGRIDANGQIVLVNQSGVTFYKGAQVNTNGLMVSAIGMSNKSVQSFVAGGKLALDQAGNPNARVDNQGNITVREAGLAALVAPQVANSGTITARLGHVVLAGAQTATLDLYGDGLLSLDVSNQVTKTPVGPDGKAATALVTNTGVIIADGGTVQLTARAADGIVQNLVEAGGKIRTATMGDHTGTIALNGVGGSIVVEGQLSAPGIAPGTKGGNIEIVSNANVVVASTARINGSGSAGGGNIGIGTTLDRVKGGLGVTPAMTAANVTVHKGAQIAANATGKGNGGRITVLSTGTTVMNGTISATGGPVGGDGGFIETSGKGILDVGSSASVTAAAPNGNAGSWLLDPDSNIDITNATSNVTCSAGVCSPSADSSTLDAATIATALNGGTSVTVTTSNPAGTQVGSITVDSQIALTAAKTVGLTLDAGAGGGAGAITLNEAITDAGSGGALSLILNAGGGIAFNNTVSLAGLLTATAGMNVAGDITQGIAGVLTAAGPASFSNQSSNGLITLNTQTNALTGGVALVTKGAAGNASLQNSGGTNLRALDIGGTFSLEDTTGSITQVATPLKVAGTALFQTDATGQTITLDDASNALAGTVTLNTTGSAADATLINHVDTTLGASTVGGNLTLTITGALSLNGVVSGNLSLTTTKAVTLNSGTYTISGGANPYVFPDVTTNGVLVFGQATRFGNTTLGSDTTIDSSAVNGNLTFGKIDGASALIVAAGTGLATFNSKIGSATPLASFSVTSDSALNANVSTSGGGQTYNGPISLGATVTLKDTGSGPIALNGQVTGGSKSLTLSTTGAETLSGVVTTGNLTLGAPSSLTLNDGIYTITGGADPYVFPAATTNGTLVVGGATTFGKLTLGSATKIDSSAASGDLIFGKIDGAQGLIINAGTGVATFNGAVGSATPLTSFSVTSDPAINADVTTAGGGQTYNGPISLGATVTLADAAGGAIALNGQVTGGNKSLTLSTSGAETLSGVTTTGDLTLGVPSSLTLNGGDYTITGGASPYLFPAVPTTLNGTLTVGQATTFNGGITLASSTKLDSSAANGALDFASTIDGTTAGVQDLTITAGTGDVTFGGAVGGAINLLSLSASGGTIDIGNIVAATSSVILNGGSVVLETAANVGAPNITLTGSKGIALLGNATLGASGSVVDLSTTSGDASEAITALITAGTLQSTNGIAGNANLVGSNAISAIGTLHATGNVVITDGSAGTLAVTGPLFGNNVTLSGSPTLAVSGSINATNTVTLNSVEIDLSSGALVTGPTVKLNAGSNGINFIGTASVGQSGGIVDINSSGAVTEALTSVIIAGTLEATGGFSGGDVRLLGTANAIDSLGNVPLGGTVAFDLKDASALKVVGTVGESTGLTSAIYLESSNAGGITISNTGLLKANSSSGLASFQTDAFVNDGSIVAAVIELAPNTSAGLVTLGGTGGLSVTPASLGSVNTTKLRVGALTLPGSASPANTAGSIVVSGNFGSASLPLELDSLGGISEANGAVLTTSTLTGSAGGPVTLLDSNAIGNLGNFQVGGGSNHFALFDGLPLVISGTVTAPGQVYIASSDVGGVTIAVAGSVGAGTLASFQTDLFVNNGSVTGTTFELGPNTAGSTLNLGSGGGIASLTGIGTTNAELGGVTVPGSGFTITAGAINTVGTFDGNALPFALRTSGTIGEGASAPIVNVTTLTGSAGGTVALTSSNSIPTLGSFNVTGGSSDFDLTDSVALIVAGPVSAGRNIYLQTSDPGGIAVTGNVAASGSGISGLQADAISIAGTVTGGTVELAPNSAVAVTLGGAGGLSLSQSTLSKIGASTLRIGAVTVPGAGLTTTSSAISVAGAIDLSGVTTILDLQSNGGVSETGQLNNVGTLTGTTGTVALTKGTDSGIGTIGDYTVTGGGDFLMANESSTGVAGTLVANNVSIVEGGVPTSMTITGTVAAAGTTNLRSETVTLATTANVQGTTITLGGHSIALNGNAVLGKAAQTSVLDVTADATGITEASTATILATTLQSTAGVFGDVSLLGVNTVSNVGNFAVTSGNFLLADTTPLTVNGGLSASGNVYLESSGGSIAIAATGAVAAGTGNLASFQADALTIAAGGTVTAGTFQFAPVTPGTLTLGSGGALASLLGVGTTNAEIGGITQPGTGFTSTATAINTVGTFDGNALPVVLNTTGAITESAGAPIINLATLTGGAASVKLDQANAIGTLGSFAATAGDFVLADNGLAGTFAVTGPVTGTNVTLSGAPTISVTGSIGAVGALALSSGSGGVELNTGHILSGATVDLSATGGGVTQVATGTITASTVLQSTSGVTGTVNLAGTNNAIASVGSFAVTGGDFTLVDTGNLGVAGALTANNITLNGPTIAATGSIGAVSALTLNAGSGGIALNTGHVLSGATIDLSATGGGVTQVATGNVTATTVLQSTSGVTGTVDLAGTNNAIASVGSFAVTGGDFTLVDTGNLGVAGALTANNITLTSPTITATGSVGAVSVLALNGGSGGIALDTGHILSGATVDLSTTGGGVTQVATGTITASTLRSTNNVVGTVNLAGVANAIAGIAGLKVVGGGDFSLTDAGNLSVTGPLTANNVTLGTDGAGSIGISPGGSIGAVATLLLNAGTGGIALSSGAVLSGGTLDLISAGAISETVGALVASVLTGSAATSATLTGSNTIAALGNFIGSTGFTLSDTSALTVNGGATVNGGSNVTITDAGALSVDGTVTGTTVNLTGPSIGIAGAVNGPTSVTLAATSGGIAETGAITTALLTGTANGAASLTGASNQIATVSNFTASGFTLNDAESLSVTGTLNGGSSATVVDNGTLTIGAGATLAAAAIGLTANNIAVPGLITDGAGSVSLIATTGTINETGTLIAGTLSGSSAGTTSLTGTTTTTNQIATLGSFSASGFTLNDGASLAVNGVLNGGPSVTVLDKGSLTIGGAVSASAIGLTAGNIIVLGVVTDGGGGSVNLIANTGSISETGTLVVGTLTGSSVGSTNLAGKTPSSNQVAMLGNFSAAGFTLNDGKALLVNGTLAGGPSAAITDAAALTIGSRVTASAIALNAASISIPGVVTDGGAGSVSLVANTGNISETGTIVTGALSGSATGAANFAGASSTANQIASLGPFVSNGFSLSDGTNLAINGTVNGGPSANILVNGSLTINGALIANTVSVTASGGIDIPGTVQDANSVNLVSTGGTISETGVLIADLLNGSAPGSVSLIGTGNQVAQIGSFSSGGTLTLVDAVNLIIEGPLSAPKIVINTGSNQITLASSAVIATGGTTRPSGVITTFPGDNPDATPAGAYLTAGGFTQVGNSFVQGFPASGDPNILRINVAGAGNIAFDQTGGLHGPNTWLILDIGTGQASGNIQVANLDVIRNGSSGGTSLSGSVAGLSGPAAAGAAGIQPSPNSNFRFNSCPIHSVNCVLLPTQGLPTRNPLNDISIGTLFNPDDSDDLLLPIVSDQDY